MKHQRTEVTSHQHALRWSVAAAVIVLAVILLAPLIAAGFNPDTSIPLVAAFFGHTSGGFQPAPAGLLSLLVFVAAGLLLTYFYKSKEAFLIRTPLAIPALLYLAIAALGMAWSVSRYASLAACLGLLSQILLMFLLVYLIVTRPRLNGVVGVLAASAAIVCLLGLQEYFIQAVAEWRGVVAAKASAQNPIAFFQYLFTTPPSWRIYGPFMNPNILAEFLIITIPILLSYYLLAQDRAHAMGLGFLVIAEVSALMLTASKGAMGALVVAMGIYGLMIALGSVDLGPRPLSRLTTIGLILLVLAATFGRQMLTRMQEATSIEAHSGAFRVYLWKSTLRMIEAHPLGAGLGTFELAYPKYALVGHTYTAHNNYLQIATEVGIPGLIAFLLVLFAVVRIVFADLGARRKGRPTRHMAVPLLMVGFATAVCASAVHSLVDFGWYIPGTALLFWMALGMTEVSAGTGQARPVRFGGIAYGATMIVLILLVFLAGRMTLGDVHAGMARYHEEHGEFEPAFDEWRSALATDPWNPAYHAAVATHLAARGEVGSGIAEIRQALAASPLETRFMQTLASLLERDGRNPEAADEFKRVTRFDPNSTDAWRMLAQFEGRSGNTRASEAAWRRVLLIQESPVGRWPAVPELVDMNPARAHFALGEADVEARRWPEAIRHFEQTDRIFGEYELAKQKLPYQAMRATGQLDLKEEQELAALRVNLLQELSRAYLAVGEKAKAEATRQRAEELRP